MQKSQCFKVTKKVSYLNFCLVFVKWDFSQDFPTLCLLEKYLPISIFWWWTEGSSRNDAHLKPFSQGIMDCWILGLGPSACIWVSKYRALHSMRCESVWVWKGFLPTSHYFISFVANSDFLLPFFAQLTSWVTSLEY